MKRILIFLGVIIVLSTLVFVLSSKSVATPSSSKEILRNTSQNLEQSKPQKIQALVNHKITLSKIGSINLKAPQNFAISVAAEGYKQLRFMAFSPDNRLFVTEMYTRGDTKKGKLYIFENFNEKTKKFEKVTTYLQNLRNPNSVAFYTDREGKTWLYLALTDKLIRYQYHQGDIKPHDAGQTIATFPDYGLNYKYGGWHLTRTVAVRDDKIYVAVGSSCNSCEEKETVRASIVQMDPDGKNQKTYATGLRNSVGITFVNNQLFATGMGADHLGNDRPEDNLYTVQEGKNYGWPYCYQYQNKIYEDNSQKWKNKTISCSDVPLAFNDFAAHSAPLGLKFFDESTKMSELKNTFLVALHGAGKTSLDRGNKIVRVQKDIPPEDFITGFLQNGKRVGRPVDIVSNNSNGFFFSDDLAGVIYYIEK
jgi:glucose/arabinose dehydrogenase